ncbi:MULTISPECIES: nucleotidyl transferase AbiEii/AbiGii toxin family protein [Desulfobacter]|uniref:nucleotidyl transferase AbiEii/AbiGii toxin family protein n=1 Tax=Desulfobacter TaxID=2289 RepID=UPI000551BA9C|nr:nucleotidyl transferase AbiEii/AbiGii toxin family protein [Desulfobacter vibrioformis]
MPGKYYSHKLYPFQDEILGKIQSLHTDFYLTGGTALGRCYLDHRYSDDLDFFVNNHPEFKKQCKVILSCLNHMQYKSKPSMVEESFVRLFVEKEDITLKIDMVNDVDAHFGRITIQEGFGNIDDWRNILSNKICALSRMEPKDYADILFIANAYDFDWKEIVAEAKEKDLWVDPIEISRMLRLFPVEQFNSINWINTPNFQTCEKAFSLISEDILKGEANQAKQKIRL